MLRNKNLVRSEIQKMNKCCSTTTGIHRQTTLDRKSASPMVIKTQLSYKTLVVYFWCDMVD